MTTATPSYDISIEPDLAFADHVDAAALEEAVAALLRHEGLSTAALAIVITDDESVRALNRDYRGVDAATDVLSFAAHDGAEAFQDAPDDLRALLESTLGDVIIAFPYAERQAAHFGNPIDAELKLLAVHGVLHLLGYDHATEEEEAALWALQEAILAPLGVKGLSQRRYEE